MKRALVFFVAACLLAGLFAMLMLARGLDSHSILEPALEPGTESAADSGNPPAGPNPSPQDATGKLPNASTEKGAEPPEDQDPADPDEMDFPPQDGTTLESVILKGTVRDVYGMPIEGVLIEVHTINLGDWLNECRSSGGGGYPCTHTVSEGRFSLETMLEFDRSHSSTFILKCEAKGYAMLIDEVCDYRKEDGEFSFTLKPGFKVQGTVTDSTGHPVRGARVHALLCTWAGKDETLRKNAYPDLPTGTTDLQGKYVIESVPDMMSRFVAVDSEGRMGSTEITIFGNDDVLVPKTCDIVLKGLCRLNVFYHDGKDDPQFKNIQLYKKTPGSPVPQGWEWADCGFTDEGKAEFSGLVPGTYKAFLWSKGCRPLTGTADVSVSRTAEIHLTFESGREITGCAVDESGNPVPDASVKLRPAPEDLDGTHAETSTRTDAAGRFSFDCAPPGNCSISVDADGFASLKLPLGRHAYPLLLRLQKKK